MAIGWILIIFLVSVPEGGGIHDGRAIAIEKIEGLPSAEACSKAWNKIIDDRKNQPAAIGHLSFSCIQRK